MWRHPLPPFVLAVGSALVACFGPNYDAPTCGPSGACPSGYMCNASNACCVVARIPDSDGGNGSDGGGRGVDGGSGSACPVAASYPMPEFGSNQLAFDYCCNDSTPPYDLITWSGHLSGSGSDVVDLGIQMQSMDNSPISPMSYTLDGITMESFAIVELLTDWGSGSDGIAHTAYIATSGTLHVTMTSPTLEGTIHATEFVRYAVSVDGNLGSADPDGCSSMVILGRVLGDAATWRLAVPRPRLGDPTRRSRRAERKRNAHACPSPTSQLLTGIAGSSARGTRGHIGESGAPRTCRRANPRPRGCRRRARACARSHCRCLRSMPDSRDAADRLPPVRARTSAR